MRFLFVLLGLFAPAWALAADLSLCANQFIGSSVDNAPTLYSSPPDEPYRINEHHCYATSDGALFALEYWPTHHVPRWVAYRLSDRYGANGCGSRPRNEMRCYFKDQNWTGVQNCLTLLRDGDPDTNPSIQDPFEEDPFLVESDAERLKTNAFVGTGHDRGHMAPNNAFSHDLCATYHTFSMANMSAQRANLNRNPWQQLEAQVLFWGANHGPIYVVTGPIFNKFPSQRFSVYRDGEYDEDELYEKNLSLTTFNAGDNRVADIRVPTGYYKVIYREATAAESAQAIAFLLPHTNENFTRFWDFVARIDVVEEASGVRFHAIAGAMKSVWGSDFFFDRDRNGWRLRNNCNHNYTASNWIENSTHAERLARCSLQ